MCKPGKRVRRSDTHSSFHILLLLRRILSLDHLRLEDYTEGLSRFLITHKLREQILQGVHHLINLEG